MHFRADSVSCIDGIMLKDPAGKELKAEWKTVSPNEVEVKLPLQESQPGAMTLMVDAIRHQSTATDPDTCLFGGRTIRWLQYPCWATQWAR